MEIGKYIYISGIIRHIYHLETNSTGIFVRDLFWIHPSTKVIHPSNRGLFSYLSKEEALEIKKVFSNLQELSKKNSCRLLHGRCMHGM